MWVALTSSRGLRQEDQEDQDGAAHREPAQHGPQARADPEVYYRIL